MMKQIVISIMVLFITIAFSISAIGENRYELLQSNNIDTSLGAKRSQYDIEVAKNMGDEEIKKILGQAVKELAKKREVDALVVFLYLKDTKLPYATAYWAPYGDWSKAEKGKPKAIFKTSIEIHSERRPNEANKHDKFGLSLEKRKQIYREICQSQKKTRKIAAQKYPYDWSKEADYMYELDEKFEKEICEKYNISDNQKYSILGEGVKNNWPD
ncbi:MAG: hypothetical protein R6U40_01780 [Desulfobacterales bacterium]